MCVCDPKKITDSLVGYGLSMTSILSSAKTQSAPEWILGTKGHREFWKTSRWGAVSLGNVAIPDKSREPRENPVIYGQFGGFSLKNPWMWGPRYSFLLHSL